MWKKTGKRGETRGRNLFPKQLSAIKGDGASLGAWPAEFANKQKRVEAQNKREEQEDGVYFIPGNSGPFYPGGIRLDCNW